MLNCSYAANDLPRNHLTITSQKIWGSSMFMQINFWLMVLIISWAFGHDIIYSLSKSSLLYWAHDILLTGNLCHLVKNKLSPFPTHIRACQLQWLLEQGHFCKKCVFLLNKFPVNHEMTYEDKLFSNLMTRVVELGKLIGVVLFLVYWWAENAECNHRYMEEIANFIRLSHIHHHIIIANRMDNIFKNSQSFFSKY